jgi:hypothetical protein
VTCSPSGTNLSKSSPEKFFGSEDLGLSIYSQPIFVFQRHETLLSC